MLDETQYATLMLRFSDEHYIYKDGVGYQLRRKGASCEL